MTTDEIRSRLFALQDVKYRDFQGGLIPGMNPENMIGVRTPELRKLAKEVGADGTFLAELPHRYFDENQLHAFIVSGIRDKQECLRRAEEFLPYVDNWATCDQMSLKCFKKSPEELLPHIREWIDSERTYTLYASAWAALWSSSWTSISARNTRRWYQKSAAGNITST